MVKRSRGQSSEAPRRRNWRVMVPPDSAFHCQTRSRNASRPSAWRLTALLGQQAFHHHLGGDAGMVGAGLPQRVAALHAPPADQRVLHREGQRMAHVQAAGDVRRRDHDGERRGVAARVAGEGAGGLPALVEPGLGGVGGMRLVEHGMALAGACPASEVVRSGDGRTAPGRQGAERGPCEHRHAAAPGRSGRGAADDPFDFGADQPLDQRRQVLVQPAFSIGRISSRTMSSSVGPPR